MGGGTSGWKGILGVDMEAVYPFIPQLWHSEVLVLPVGASSLAGKCCL